MLEEHGYVVFSVDWDAQWAPDLVIDVLKWRYKERFKPGDFDIVAASPPCTEYSAALTTRPRRMKEADRVVARTRAIIEYLKPRLWWIENPRHGRLRERQVVRDLNYVDLDYCMFEQWGYQKPTRFWIPRSMANKSNVLCNGDCGNMVQTEDGRRHHRVRISGKQGPRARREMAYRIPRGVVEYLCGFQNLALPEALTPEDGKPDETQPREVTVKPWQYRPLRPFRIGRMEARGGSHQLMMNVVVQAGAVRRTFKALIDTGAQTSLVRRGSLPESCFQPARRPLLLRTVSGEELQGGKQEVQLRVEFQAETEDGAPAEPWISEITVHDGDVGCDLILGYPWLKQVRLDVQPWRDALQLHDEPRLVLKVAGSPNRVKRGDQNALVQVTSCEATGDDEELELCIA